MSISVVMTSYNGADRILPQLISLRDQSRKADEVLIFDDCSTDKTVEIIQNFIYENQLYEWTLVENPENKGWRQNFTDAINTARGNLIFLCDQDDEWKKEKIETMEKIMEERPEINVLASNYDVRYEKGARKIKSWMLKPYGKERIEKVQPEGRTFDPVRPGCTYAFRRELIPFFNRIRREEDAHDRILWDIGLLTDSLYILNEALVVQVRFADNSTPANATGGNARKELIAYRREFAERFLGEPECSGNRAWLEEYIRVARAREEGLSGSSVKKLRALSRDSAYMPLSVSWMLDILSVIREKI